MMARHRNPEPDKWKKRIRKPVEPPETSTLVATFGSEVHPGVQKLVNAQSGNEAGFEALGLKPLPPDVVVPFERSNSPSFRALGDEFA